MPVQTVKTSAFLWFLHCGGSCVVGSARLILNLERFGEVPVVDNCIGPEPPPPLGVPTFPWRSLSGKVWLSSLCKVRCLFGSENFRTGHINPDAHLPSSFGVHRLDVILVRLHCTGRHRSLRQSYHLFNGFSFGCGVYTTFLSVPALKWPPASPPRL